MQSARLPISFPLLRRPSVCVKGYLRAIHDSRRTGTANGKPPAQQLPSTTSFRGPSRSRPNSSTFAQLNSKNTSRERPASSATPRSNIPSLSGLFDTRSGWGSAPKSKPPPPAPAPSPVPSPSTFLAPPRSGRVIPDDKLKAKKLRRHPRDEEITHRDVFLIDPVTGQVSSTPTTVRALLATYNPPNVFHTGKQKKEYFVELVSVTDAGAALVKVKSCREDYAKAKEAKVRAKEARERNVIKEVQMTWTMAPGDAEHKVAKAREELERGRKVDLVFVKSTGKQGGAVSAALGGAKLTRSAMEGRLEEVVARILDVGKEWKKREFRGTTAVVYLQGLNAGIANEEKAKEKRREKQQRADDLDDEDGFVA